MAAPLILDSITLTLGRFVRKQHPEATIPLRRVELNVTPGESSRPTLITLSSGQMLLPVISKPHRFLN